MSKTTEEFNDTVKSLFEGMDGYLSTKTVVSDPIHIGDTIIIPLVNVSFGVGAGNITNEKKDSSGGGLSGKMTPSAVLVISNGTTRLVNIKNQDNFGKIIDMVPDIVNKIAQKNGPQVSDETVVSTAFPEE